LPRKRRVVPVSVILHNPDEVAPGPSQLGTGERTTLNPPTLPRIPDRAYYLAPFAYCLVPIAKCLSPIAYCLLPSA